MDNFAIVKEFNHIIDRRSWDEFYDIISEDFHFRTPFYDVQGRLEFIDFMKQAPIESSEVEDLYFFHNDHTDLYYVIFKATYYGERTDILICHQSFEMKERHITSCNITTTPYEDDFYDLYLNQG